MKRRKILGASATALAVAVAFGAPSSAVAQNTSVQFYGRLDLSIDDQTKGIQFEVPRRESSWGSFDWMIGEPVADPTA